MAPLRYMTLKFFVRRNGRTFDHNTLEEIRLMAVERVREGESASKAIEAYGFNRTTTRDTIRVELVALFFTAGICFLWKSEERITLVPRRIVGIKCPLF